MIDFPGKYHNLMGKRVSKHNLQSTKIPLNYISQYFWDFQQYDTDKDTQLKYSEIVTVLDYVCSKFRVMKFSEKFVKAVCNIYDKKGDGLLGYEDYKRVLLHLSGHKRY